MVSVQNKPTSIYNTKIKTAEQYWIERARTNPVDFIIYMTGGEKRPGKHHIDWLTLIFNYDIRNLIIEGFPGSAKTTVAVYALAFTIGNLPYLTHMFCSVSEDQAEQRLADVREVLESVRYQNVFPHIHIDNKRRNNSTSLNVWSDRWIDGRRIDYTTYRQYVRIYGEQRDDTIFACGITSKSITGKRICGFIFVDDPHNETNSATPDQREKVANAIKKELMSRFPARKSDYAKIVIIMTPWAEDDCAGRLMLDRWSDGRPVWVLAQTPVMDENGNPTWEIMTKDDVEKIRAEKGEIIFNLMYMLIATAMAGKKVTLDMMRRGLPNPLPKFKDVTVSIDLSKTVGLQADWNVCIAVGRDLEKFFRSYFLEGIRFQDENIGRRVERIIEFCDQVNEHYGMLTRVLFENVDSKAEVSMIRELRPDLPIVTVQLKGDKEIRFNAYAGHIQQERFFYNQHSEIIAVVQSETIGFPKAAHDDCVDPFSLLFQQNDWVNRKMKAKLHTIRSPYLM